MLFSSVSCASCGLMIYSVTSMVTECFVLQQYVHRLRTSTAVGCQPLARTYWRLCMKALHASDAK